jgi:3-keto-L-gulonate-6-phosphate decarboxylase
MLDNKTRYLQLAFNDDIASVLTVLPQIPFNDRILIEAGTPFIKAEGFKGIRKISELWPGKIVADLKTCDGAITEVEIAHEAGASAATVLGSSSVETLNLFIRHCSELGMDSMIDMLGVEEPLKVLTHLRSQPSVVIIHKGRDEETTKGKVIKYKHISKIKSKFDIIISAAGGVDLREARSAIFNGANIVVVNIVSDEDSWKGIKYDEDIADIAEQFLKTIE